MALRQRTDRWRRATSLIPGGVNSPVRAMRAVGVDEPVFVVRGAGATVEDVDGNRYVDWVQSWGPLVFGHADPEIVDAVREAAAEGTTFGAPTEREVELAEEIADAVPSVEKVRLVSSGTEAAMSAVRLARVLLVPLCLACAADSAFMLLRPTDVLYARRGVVAIIHKSSYEALAWLEQNAHPGDGYFGSQVVNWLNGLKNPGTVEWVEPNAYTRPEQVRDLIRGLDRCGRCFVEPVDEESTPRNPQDNLDPLCAYLASHFHVVHTFSNGMPLLLNNSADPSPH